MGCGIRLYRFLRIAFLSISKNMRILFDFLASKGSPIQNIMIAFIFVIFILYDK